MLPRLAIGLACLSSAATAASNTSLGSAIGLAHGSVWQRQFQRQHPTHRMPHNGAWAKLMLVTEVNEHGRVNIEVKLAIKIRQG